MKRSKATIAGPLVGLMLLALTSSALEAQTTLGVRGGVSVSSADLDLDETFDESNRTGFVGGIFLDFGASNILGFQIGAEYTQRGVETDFGEIVEDLSLNYLTIPAVVKLGIPLGHIKPSVFGGLEMGFNTGCDPYIVNGVDLCDELDSVDFAGVFGADLSISLSSLSLWLDGRYNVGLKDVSGDLEFVDDLKNRAWTFQAGIGFPLGR